MLAAVTGALFVIGVHVDGQGEEHCVVVYSPG